MNGGEPYLHLVDGGISDNLGLRGGLDVFNWMEALREAGHTTPFDHVQQIVVVVVNSVSTPKTDWNKSEDPPGTIPILVKAAGVPIDRYSNEQIEYLRDIEARWNAMRSLRDLPAIQRISKRIPTRRWKQFVKCRTPKSIRSMCRLPASRTPTNVTISTSCPHPLCFRMKP